MTKSEPRVALISREPAAGRVARILTKRGIRAVHHATLDALMRAASMRSISVIVIDLNGDGRSNRLGTIGRIAFEHPHVQLIAVLEQPPSPAAGAYLTSCAVDLARGRLTRKTAGEIASLVTLVCERQEWSLAAEPATRELAL